MSMLFFSQTRQILVWHLFGLMNRTRMKSVVEWSRSIFKCCCWTISAPPSFIPNQINFNKIFAALTYLRSLVLKKMNLGNQLHYLFINYHPFFFSKSHKLSNIISIIGCRFFAGYTFTHLEIIDRLIKRSNGPYLSCKSKLF